MPKSSRASVISTTSEMRPVRIAVTPCAIATAAAGTGVTRRRRSRPVSRCCTSGSATPNSAPDINVVVSRPGIKNASHARIAARHHETEQQQEAERKRRHPEECGLRAADLGQLRANQGEGGADHDATPTS